MTLMGTLHRWTGQNKQRHVILIPCWDSQHKCTLQLLTAQRWKPLALLSVYIKGHLLDIYLKWLYGLSPAGFARWYHVASQCFCHRQTERERDLYLYYCYGFCQYFLSLCNCVPVSLAVCRRTEGGCLDLKCIFFSAAPCNARCAQSALIRDFHLISE